MRLIHAKLRHLTIKALVYSHIFKFSPVKRIQSFSSNACFIFVLGWMRLERSIRMCSVHTQYNSIASIIQRAPIHKLSLWRYGLMSDLYIVYQDIRSVNMISFGQIKILSTSFMYIRADHSHSIHTHTLKKMFLPASGVNEFIFIDC